LFVLSCPGNFSILPTGMKDCSKCVLPHAEEGWDMVQQELQRQLYNLGPQPGLPLE